MSIELDEHSEKSEFERLAKELFDKTAMEKPVKPEPKPAPTPAPALEVPISELMMPTLSRETIDRIDQNLAEIAQKKQETVSEPPPELVAKAEAAARGELIVEPLIQAPAEPTMPPAEPLAPEAVLPPPQPLTYVPYTNLKTWDEWGVKTFNARDEIIVTEYVWGLACTIHREKGTFFLMGDFSPYPLDPGNPVRRLVAQLLINEKLETMFPNTDVTLYGVVYEVNPSEPFNYKYQDPVFAFFDLTVAGKYMPDYQLIRFSNNSGLSRVPICYRGKFNSLAIQHVIGPSKVLKDHPKAGIVIKSDNFPNHPMIGRKILIKYSPEFLKYQEVAGIGKTTIGD